MPDYRFADPVRQTDLRHFAIKLAEVAVHMIEWGFELSNIRLRLNRLTFTSSGTIAPNEMAALELENG